MTGTAQPTRPAAALRLGRRQGFMAAAAALVLLGLVGASHAAVGYGLFMVATLLLIAGLALLAIFALTRWFATEPLRRAYATAFWLGAWTYVLAVGALAGYFVYEALAGRIEWRLMLFGPAALAAIIILDYGIWRVIVQRNLPTVRRFGDLWAREALDQPALRRVLVNEVILHRALFGISPFRWLRHQLIFWGFGLMFLIEMAAVALREAFPAFGWTDLWHEPGHPIRLAFDFSYDLTGLMILVGCILALVFRMRVRNVEEQKYTDTPTTLFLLFVTLSGFLTEGARMSLNPGAPGETVSFVGYAFAAVLGEVAPAEYDGLWVIHALAACAFIAYLPLSRLIHSCATPIGRLVNSQQGLLAARKARSLAGMLMRKTSGP